MVKPNNKVCKPKLTDIGTSKKNKGNDYTGKKHSSKNRHKHHSQHTNYYDSDHDIHYDSDDYTTQQNIENVGNIKKNTQQDIQKDTQQDIERDIEQNIESGVDTYVSGELEKVESQTQSYISKLFNLNLKVRISLIFSGAFIFLAALAWRDAVDTFITTCCPQRNTLILKFIWAIIVTGIVILFLYSLLI